MDSVKVHDGWVLRMVHVDDLGVVASASADCTVKIMKLESREILCVCISVAAASAQSASSQLSHSSWPCITSTNQTMGLHRGCFRGHHNSVRSVVYCKWARCMASCGSEREVLLWDPYTQQEVGRLVGHTSPVLVIVAAPLSHVAMGSTDD